MHRQQQTLQEQEHNAPMGVGYVGSEKGSKEGPVSEYGFRDVPTDGFRDESTDRFGEDSETTTQGTI